MAIYGLEDGVTDQDNLGYCLIDRFKVAAGASGSKSYPEWSDKTLKAMAFMTEYTGGHSISVTGDTVYWTGITMPSTFVIRSSDSYINVYAR